MKKVVLLSLTMILSLLVTGCESGKVYSLQECGEALNAKYPTTYFAGNGHYYTMVNEMTVALNYQHDQIAVFNEQSDYKGYTIVSVVRFTDLNKVDTYYKGAIEQEHAETEGLVEGLETTEGYDFLLKHMKEVKECKAIAKSIDKRASETKEDVLNTIAPKAISLNQTFQFKNLEIIIGDQIEWRTINRKYNDLNGREAALLPIKITNNTNSSENLSSSYYKIFNPNGIKLDTLTYELEGENIIGYSGDVRAGGTLETYLPILFDGNGKYVIEFDNYESFVEVTFELNK